MARKRGNNEGTIYQLPSGSWRAQICTNGLRMGSTSKSKSEAQKWVRDMLGKIEQGYTGRGSKIQLEEFLSNWLSQKSTSIKNSTWNLYECVIRNHIIPSLGKQKLSEISAQKIQRFLIEKDRAGAGKRTLRVIHTILNNSMNGAVKVGLIYTNPVQAVAPPNYETPEMQAYSSDEITQLLLAFKGSGLEAMIYIAITTGLRQSELLALKWSDVDWSRNTISVQRQLLRRIKDRNYYSSLKTKSGRRTLSLGGNSIDILREHRAKQIDKKEDMGNRWVDNDLIFPSDVGTPMNQRNLIRKYKMVLQESGLRVIRFHDLRHTAASLMLNNGISPLIVAQRLGHSKVSITLDTYGHLLPGMQQETANYIDDLITPVPIKLHTNCTRTEVYEDIKPKDPYILGSEG